MRPLQGLRQKGMLCEDPGTLFGLNQKGALVTPCPVLAVGKEEEVGTSSCARHVPQPRHFHIKTSLTDWNSVFCPLLRKGLFPWEAKFHSGKSTSSNLVLKLEQHQQNKDFCVYVLVIIRNTHTQCSYCSKQISLPTVPAMGCFLKTFFVSDLLSYSDC